MTQRSGPPQAAIAVRKKDSRTKVASVEQALKRLLKQKVTEIDKSHLAAGRPGVREPSSIRTSTPGKLTDRAGRDPHESVAPE